ncbi:MAG TPA: ABC transporter permease [Desulfobulbus sp.]|nr:ABC transporter permease [Desulfobulbus sp.]
MFRLTAKIAWASLKRRPSRSILLVVMIAVSLWGLLFMEGIYDGMTEQMITNAIRSDCGHISLFGKGYRRDPAFSRWLRNSGQLTTFLDKDRRVKSYVTRLRQDGLVATAHYSRGAVFSGVDLAAEERQAHSAGYLLDGKYSFGNKQRGAIIGYKLARKLQVRIGSKIIVSVQDSTGEVSARPYKVTGILKTNNLVFDENMVLIAKDTMRSLLAMPSGVSQVAILVRKEADVAGLQHDLQTSFSDIDARRWDELYPALLQSQVIMRGFNLVTNILIFCVAALGIFGVILVSVLERLHEFGIMQAIGAPFGQVRNIVLVESIILGGTGFCAGSLLGLFTLLYFKIYGLDLSFFNEALAEIGMDVVTYAVIRPEYFLTALIAVIPAIFFSVLIPLRVLKKTRPIHAINAV